jgi:hypothetical protein
VTVATSGRPAEASRLTMPSSPAEEKLAGTIGAAEMRQGVPSALVPQLKLPAEASFACGTVVVTMNCGPLEPEAGALPETGGAPAVAPPPLLGAADGSFVDVVVPGPLGVLAEELDAVAGDWLFAGVRGEPPPPPACGSPLPEFAEVELGEVVGGGLLATGPATGGLPGAGAGGGLLATGGVAGGGSPATGGLTGGAGGLPADETGGLLGGVLLATGGLTGCCGTGSPLRCVGPVTGGRGGAKGPCGGGGLTVDCVPIGFS